MSSSENASIDPASALLSPPSGKATTPTPGSIHAFFTPRRALGTLPPNSTNSRSSRIHLLSPDDSPCRSTNKRQRGIESSPIAHRVSCRPPVLPEEPELPLPPPRQRVRPNSNVRMLMRSMGGFGMGRGRAERRSHGAGELGPRSRVVIDAYSSGTGTDGSIQNGPKRFLDTIPGLRIGYGLRNLLIR